MLWQCRRYSRVTKLTRGNNDFYIHTAYSINPDGSDLVLQEFDEAEYIGTYENDSPAESLNPNDYTWSIYDSSTSEQLTDIDVDTDNTEEEIANTDAITYATEVANNYIQVVEIDDPDIETSPYVGELDAELVNVKNLNAGNITTGTLSAERIDTNEITAKVVASESIKTEIANITTAEIGKATIKDAQIESINGSKITDGSIVAKALSSDVIQTVGGNKVYYQATEPTGGTYKSGDTWYKTVIADTDEDKNVLHVWDGTAWQPSDFDGRIIRENTITAQEIASGTITADKININDLQTNLARIGPKAGQHLDIDPNGFEIKDGLNSLGKFSTTEIVLGNSSENYYVSGTGGGSNVDPETGDTVIQFPDIINKKSPHVYVKLNEDSPTMQFVRGGVVGLKITDNTILYTLQPSTTNVEWGVYFGSNINNFERSLVFGERNTGIVDGLTTYDMLIFGQQNTANCYGESAMIGRGLTISKEQSLAVGKYNKTQDGRLVVGNGTRTSPSDAFVVDDNGNVIAGGKITANSGTEIIGDATIEGNITASGDISAGGTITSTGKVTASGFQVDGTTEPIGTYYGPSVASGTTVNTTMKSICSRELTKGRWIVTARVILSNTVTSAKSIQCNMHRNAGQAYYMHTNYSPSGQYLRCSFPAFFNITEEKETIHLNARVTTGSDTVSTDSGFYAIKIR